MSMLLGIDVGTTATKVSVAAVDGRVVAEVSAPCRITTSAPGHAEADPAQWWSNVTGLVPAALAEAGLTGTDIAAIGVSGMVPTLICVDADGRPLRPSIQQNDARATDEIARVRTALADTDVLARTGSAVTQQSIGPKVAWLATHEPATIDRTSRICGSYEWVGSMLTGELVTERNWALESGLWDLAAGDWGDDLLAAAGVDRSWLGHPRASHELVGEVTAAAAAATGLAAGTPVSAGAADHIASTFSAGLATEGDLLVKLGGAGDILLVLSRPVTDARLFLDHHLRPEQWILNGCMAASGAVLRWFQRELAGGAPFDVLDEEAGRVRPGSDGLVVLPYFLGEKSPIQDPDARGMLAGLHLGHTRAHVHRAILESIAFGFAHHVEVLGELGLPIGRVRVTNGGSRSRLWRTIVADVLGLELASIVSHPGSSLGAAFAAGVGAGLVEWDDIEDWAAVEETIAPDGANATVYRERYGQYRALYESSRDVVHDLAASQRDLEVTGG
jgi:xylulokinase